MGQAVKVFKLSEPIQFGSEQITELQFQKPIAKHFKKMKIKQDLELETILKVAAELTGQPDSVIEMLSPDDMWGVVNLVGELSGNGPKTPTAP